jgi:hypothetical protein
LADDGNISGNSETDPFGWSVWRTAHTSSLPEEKQPQGHGPLPCANILGAGRNLQKVQGVTFAGDSYLLLSLSTEPQGVAGAVALFGFGDHGGEIGPLVQFKADVKPPGDLQDSGPAPIAPIDGTDYFAGGAIRSHRLSETLHRIYTTSNDSGAVVEFELEYGSVSSTPLTQLSTWSDGTHFTETNDCRPYDIGHPDGLPMIFVSRFLQTVAVLAAHGFEVEPPE